jgi:hypothetical protein
LGFRLRPSMVGGAAGALAVSSSIARHRRW